MKYKLIALICGTTLAIQALAQDAASPTAPAGGAVTGGENAAGTVPPLSESASTNAAARIPSAIEGGISVNQPRALPPTSRSVLLVETNQQLSSTDEKTAPKSDQEVKSAIRQTLATEISSTAGESYSSFSGALPITCDVENGVATLMGSVGSVEQKQKIELIVESVPGVNRVENLILISNGSATAGTNSDTNRLSATSTRTNQNTQTSPQKNLGNSQQNTTPGAQPPQGQQRRQQLFPGGQAPK